MRKLKNFGENGIVIATVVIFFILTLSACYFLGGAGFLSTAFGIEGEDKNYYFLSTAGFDDVTLARQNAELIRLRGGAGYVDMTDGNSIILAVYPSESSANSVLDKMTGEGIIARPIAIKNVRIDTEDKELSESVEDAMTYFELAFDTLYNLSNDLADGRMVVEDVSVKIKVLYAQIEDIKSTFYENTKDCTVDTVTEIKLALVTCLAIIDAVEIGDLAITLSSLRRQAVQLVFCRASIK